MFKDLFNARFVLESNRMSWIDYARGICIILVCYRHCFIGLESSGVALSDYPLLQVLNVCFYSFRMPLFFIISGLFVTKSLQRKGLPGFVKSRFGMVFYPLLIWGSLQITLQLIFKDHINATPSPHDYINLIIYPRNPTNNQQFWYLNALFFVGVFYAFFKVVCRFKWWHQMLLAIVFYGLSAYMVNTGNGYYIFPDVFHYYIYFWIGDMAAEMLTGRISEQQILKPLWLTISAIFFVSFQTLFTILNMKHSDDNYIALHIPALYLAISLCGCLFIIQLSMLLERANVLRWLRVTGYHSLYIYVMHIMVIAGLRVLLVRMLHIYNVPLVMIICIVLGVVLPILIYNICLRLGMWWLFTLKKPKGELEYYETKLKTA